MSSFEFEDLDVFFVDFGEDITWNSLILPCIFNRSHDPLAIGANGRLITATVKWADFPGVLPDDVVEVQGETFTIAEIQPIQDGRILKLFLEET